MSRNSIEVVVYHYADSCSPPVGLCRQYFPSPLAAVEFLESQGYRSIAVNEYRRPTTNGGGMYRAVITDHRPVTGRAKVCRTDWRKLEVRHDGQ